METLKQEKITLNGTDISLFKLHNYLNQIYVKLFDAFLKRKASVAHG